MKQKYAKIFALSIMIVFISAFVFAAKPNIIPAKAENKVGIPAHAVKVAPGKYYLGKAIDKGKVVEGYMFVKNKKAKGKPTCNNNDVCEPELGERKNCADCSDGGTSGDSTCYTLMAKGAKWKTTESYITGQGIDPVITETSLNAWDSEVSFDVFGPRDVNGIVDGPDDVSPDGKNEVEVQNLGSSSTIAYTIVWGIFSGPPRQRELVEWDAVFNTYYQFGDANVDPLVMDYQNIATHEFGHSLGLSHPAETCTEETMYAYAGFGETKKRTLEAGDIAGVNKLY